MSGTSGCRVHLPDGMGVEYFIDAILDSQYGDDTILDLIDEYEESNNMKLVDAQGEDQEKLKKKYEKYGDRYGQKQYWKKDNEHARLEKVLLEIPPQILQKMFPGISSSNWLVFLQSADYDAAGNPIMEKVTEFDSMGNKVEVERPKTSIWRIEYDYYDEFGQGSRVCDDKVTNAMWEKMLEGLVDRMKNGGMSDAIAAAHRANMEKNPAFKTVGAKVGSKIYKQTDPDGNDSLCFDVVMTDEYTPEEPNEYGPQFDTPSSGGKRQTV